MKIRITRIAVLSVLVLLTQQSAVMAQQYLQKKAQSMLRETVDACVVVVRKESEAPYTTVKSTFNAYSKSDGTIRFFGTEQERFSFEKCMHDRGHPMKME